MASAAAAAGTATTDPPRIASQLSRRSDAPRARMMANSAARCSLSSLAPWSTTIRPSTVRLTKSRASTAAIPSSAAMNVASRALSGLEKPMPSVPCSARSSRVSRLRLVAVTRPSSRGEVPGQQVAGLLLQRADLALAADERAADFAEQS